MVSSTPDVKFFEGEQASKFTQDAIEFCKEFERQRRATVVDVVGLGDHAADRRQQLVEELLGGRALPQTVQLVSFVVGGGRGRVLHDVIGEFLELAAARKSSAVAEVRSAAALDESQKQRLAAALSGIRGRDVLVNVTVDPTVVGGIEVRIGDELIDGTLSNRIEQARRRLTS